MGKVNKLKDLCEVVLEQKHHEGAQGEIVIQSCN